MGRVPATQLAIASTFTADGIAEPLSWWMQRLAIPTSIRFAAWGQLFQTVLDRSGAFFQNTGGINIALLRIGDLGGVEPDATRAAGELAEAMRAAAAVAPLVVCVLPSRSEHPRAWVPRVEETFCTELRGVAGIVVLAHEDVRREYPVDQIFDPYRERLGEIPYTEVYFTAIASSLARRIRCVRTEPKKVVVVDCDDTLWGGLCGEAGPAGITLDHGRLALQQFLVEQHEAGMLVCICSRNNEDDVMRVFDNRPDMLLRKDHVTAWRVNWNPKSESINAIARELDLGIESFVFLDDDAFVGAEVRERCPGITVVQVPDSRDLAHFIRHLWVFDRLRVTDADRNRAQYYRDHVERERTRASSASLQDFLANLELVIRIAPLADAQVPRVAQLTQRTNQFNGTGIRRTESQLRELVEHGYVCHVIDVSDRFGSYGLVGVVIARASATTLDIETFLLSCRVLGRGVEHHVVAELGRMAAKRGLGQVTLRFRKTAKNAPFEQFFRALPASFQSDEDDTVVARIDAARAATLAYQPDERVAPPDDPAPEKVIAGADSGIDYGDIARRYAHAAAIHGELAATRSARAVGSTGSQPAGDQSQLDSQIIAIWREVLGFEDIGVNDDFFGLGGSSLEAINMYAAIYERLGVELPLTGLFTTDTTVRSISDLVAKTRDEAAVPADNAAEQALAASVVALPESAVTAQLAEWSQVMLEVRPSPTSESLSGARRELFDRLAAQHRIDHHVSQPLARRTSDVAPMTMSQQIAWDSHQRGNLPAIVNQPTVVGLHGRLEVPALQRAIAALADRQPALRTVFEGGRDHLTQTVRSRGPDLEVIDLSRVAPGERDARARALFAEISRPHDLARESFRAQLVRLDDANNLLFLAPHHIVCDGFSRRLLGWDLASLYRAQVGPEPELPPLAFQFSDFCFWQTTLEARPLGKQQLEYWARTVGGYEDMELPGDLRATPRGTIGLGLDTHAAATLPFHVEGAAWQAVERTCARLGCTPQTVIATGFLLLLSRWSGHRDTCVLNGNFHRNRRGSEAIIGNFYTVYPLRVGFDDDATLDAAVLRCHEAVLANRENGHVAPTSALAAWSKWTRYTFNYLVDAGDDVVSASSDLGTATARLVSGWNETKLRPDDLALVVRQVASGVRGVLAYNAERFSPELATRAVSRLGQLVDAITTAPATLVRALPGAP